MPSSTEEGSQRRSAARAKAEALVDELNEGVRAGGDPEHRPPDLKSTGESNAAVARIKEELRRLGIEYFWDGSRYVLKAGG